MADDELEEFDEEFEDEDFDDLDDPDALEEDDEIETDLEADEIEADADDAEDVEITPVPKRRGRKDKEGEEDEEEDEDELDDEVEASLDEILRERLVVDDDDDEDAATPEADDRGDLATKVLPKQADEFVCQSCFLVKQKTQLADKKRQLCRDCV